MINKAIETPGVDAGLSFQRENLYRATTNVCAPAGNQRLPFRDTQL